MPRLPDPALSYWPTDTSRPLLDLAAGDALRQAAERHPDRCALVEVVPKGFTTLTGATRTDRRWTYSELLAQAEQCAHWMLGRFALGDHICLWAPNEAVKKLVSRKLPHYFACHTPGWSESLRPSAKFAAISACLES